MEKESMREKMDLDLRMLERQAVQKTTKEKIGSDRRMFGQLAIQKKTKEVLASLPHVFKDSQTSWSQGVQAIHKYLISEEWNVPLEERRFPIYTLGLWRQLYPPGWRSGKHRHFGEAILYVMEGKGWEVHDGIRYDWEEGDVVCVPTYSVHQHFTDPSTEARVVPAASKGLGFMGLGSFEQIEPHSAFKMEAGDEQFLGKVEKLEDAMVARKVVIELEKEPETLYDSYLKALVEENRWRQNCPHVVRGRDRHWERTRMGKIKYLVHHQIPSGIYTMDAFLQELPPGGSSGKHRHVAEEVHFILEGRGYDIHDGARWDWEREDALVIPVNTVHQHFNSDPKKPALFYSVQSRLYAAIGHGGIEHLEDASDYKGH